MIDLSDLLSGRIEIYTYDQCENEDQIFIRIEIPNGKFVLYVPTIWIDLTKSKLGFSRSMRLEKFRADTRHWLGACQVYSDAKVNFFLLIINEGEDNKKGKEKENKRV